MRLIETYQLIHLYDGLIVGVQLNPVPPALVWRSQGSNFGDKITPQKLLPPNKSGIRKTVVENNVTFRKQIISTTTTGTLD